MLFLLGHVTGSDSGFTSINSTKHVLKEDFQKSVIVSLCFLCFLAAYGLLCECSGDLVQRDHPS